ncbi:MAG: TVP38/TMEM64 family protein [Thermoanaerobaculia bacterium]|nr:TVP38/TMEM64 family protein [Thermoanaerobaculia bacterium]
MPPEPTPDSRGTLHKILVSLGALVALGALFFLGRHLGNYLPTFADWVAEQGAWGPVVFILGYAVATVALVPGSVLTLAAGAVFGLVRGTAFVFLGASLGACLAFLISRYVARAAVERRLAGNPRFANLDRAVGSDGRRITFLLRLSPVFPFSLLNYGLGLTRVRFVDYALACFGMLPGTLLYVYYGHLAGSVAAAAGGATDKGTGYWVLLGLGLVATVAVTTVVTKIARRALKEDTQDGVE